ncbi:SPOSA6832_03497 [Sporobolomyces salmonicolor]|uniref:Very-long-chain (3R)-3-hydroxyacyl-CoA dehydratase n=1 Tax=Sporidiobolus salmonicolor TaxID=5005 RepID=A0A0D6ENX2_SPOSA|nr:SPOSA6832_03497 [Sporobolomyces salmonicolor]
MTPNSSTSSSSPSKRSLRPSAAPSPIKTLYLTAYNLASALAWGYVLLLLVDHMTGEDGYTSVREWLGVQGQIETLDKRAKSGFEGFGETVKWVQTAAILEAVHSATRLVRSPLGTTVAQISSRLLIVWYICVVFPEVPRTPFYISMVAAWSFAEIIRYLHYASALLNVKVPVLEWIRCAMAFLSCSSARSAASPEVANQGRLIWCSYTAFYVLYPVGAGSEATLIAFSAPYAKEKFGVLGYLATMGLTCFWPPALAFMMSHMHRQRRKHLRATRSSFGTSGSLRSSTPSTPPKTVAPKDITSHVGKENVIEALATATPARSTRSRTKTS